MLKLTSYEIESYLREKNLLFRRRGQKAECRLCPFCSGGEHGDKYTFVVYLDQTGGNFKCMRGSCAQSGSFWQLAEHFGDDPKEFYSKSGFGKPRSKADQSKPTIAFELKPNLTFKTEPIEPQKITTEAGEYLKKRGFFVETIDELPIWCDEKGFINFGYYYEGDLCFVKVRQPRKPEKGEPKAWAKWKGGLRTLWLLELCDFTKPYIVITFGEYDAAALKQARIENVVSVPSGDTDLEWINVCYEQLKDLSEIYLWIDNDEAGMAALPKIAARLGERKIKIVTTPYKDANEMLVLEAKKNGIEAAEAAIYAAVHEAKWLYKGDVMQFADIPESDNNFNGYLTGLTILDENLGGSLFGRLTLHSGSNKAGKSTAINQIVATSIEQGAIVCVYAGEDEPSSYKYNMQVHVGGYEGSDVKTSKAGAQYAEIKQDFKRKIDDWAFNRLFVITRRSNLNEDTIIENFRLAFERYGCDRFVVDNLMKLVASKDTNNLNFRQTQVINKLSDFAKETRSIVDVIVHTNKTDDETAPPKTSRDIAGAKEIVNLCDSAINWWRVPEDKKSEYGGSDSVCTILENRVFGIKKQANLIYDWRIRRFAEDSIQLRDSRYNLEIQ